MHGSNQVEAALGIAPLKEMVELAQLRLFGHVA
jgi:hypothetical protein